MEHLPLPSLPALLRSTRHAPLHAGFPSGLLLPGTHPGAAAELLLAHRAAGAHLRFLWHLGTGPFYPRPVLPFSLGARSPYRAFGGPLPISVSRLWNAQPSFQSSLHALDTCCRTGVDYGRCSFLRYTSETPFRPPLSDRKTNREASREWLFVVHGLALRSLHAALEASAETATSGCCTTLKRLDLSGLRIDWHATASSQSCGLQRTRRRRHQ